MPRKIKDGEEYSADKIINEILEANLSRWLSWEFMDEVKTDINRDILENLELHQLLRKEVIFRGI